MYKNAALLLFLGSMVFMAIGDRVLPSPLSNYSWQMRTGINQLLTGAQPQLRQQKPHERTEKAVEKLESNRR